MLNALVAYKGKPARITNQTTHKFEILFEDGSTIKVREKDFRFIHPQFLNVKNTEVSADFSILDEFQGETLSLQEITEWLFDEFNPQSAWNSYLLVEDGLYVYWQKDKAFVRPNEQVYNIKAKRQAELLEAESLNSCIENINNNTFEDSDLIHIQAIEKVALNKSKHAKVLSLLGIENSSVEAHKLLLKLNYYKDSFNPYPQRHNIPKDEDYDIESIKIERVDLTYLESYAIDNSGSADADDAISIDGDKIWVHIADVSSVVESGSELDIYARMRASNLYLPDQVIHMLPLSITHLCALGITETSNALSIGFSIDGDDIIDISIIKSIIKVKKISYEDADLLIDSNKSLSKLSAVVKLHQKYRKENGAISLDLPNVDVRLKDDTVSIKQQSYSPSRELVAEMMVLAGRVVAKFAIDNDIVMPYAVQDEGDFPQEILDNSDSLTLSESFRSTKHFKRSAISTNNKPHFGLGLGAYLRVTSPLRRYLDLLVHQQLSCFINGKDTQDKAQIKQIVSDINSAMPSVTRTVRSSNDHYKCLYLLQNKSWQGEGTIVDVRGDKALVLIPSLGMLTQIKLKTPPELDDKITIRATNVDISELSVNFNKL